MKIEFDEDKTSIYIQFVEGQIGGDTPDHTVVCTEEVSDNGWITLTDYDADGDVLGIEVINWAAVAEVYGGD